MRSIFLPIIIAISLLVGCNKSAPKAVEALNRAEAVMEEHPDSAFKILSAIDTATLHTDADRALYALLYTQAQVKAMDDNPEDSLIISAVKYYDKYGNQYNKMLANFYYGFKLSLQDSLAQSIPHLLTALDIAEESDDKFYASLVSRELAAVFQKSYNPAEEVEYAEKAYQYIQESGQQSYIDWAMATLGMAYLNHRMNNKSINLSIQQLATLNNDSTDCTLKAEILRTLTQALILEHRNSEAIHYLEQLSKLPLITDEDKAWIGLCYALKGEKDSVTSILQNIDTLSAATNWLNYELYTQIGEKDLAFDALKNMHESNEQLINNRFTQRATLSMLKHHEHAKAIAKEQAKTARITTWFVIITSILILSIGLFIFTIIRHKQQEERKKNEIIAQKLHQSIQLNEIERNRASKEVSKIQEVLQETQHKYETIREKTTHLSESIGEKEEEIEQLNQTLNQINEQYNQQKQIFTQYASLHNSMIDKVCTLLWENPTYEAASGKITNWIDNFINEMGSSSEKLKELENFADKCYDNIMADLRKENLDLKDEDFKLFLFNLFGLSSAAVARLLSVERIDPVYTRKKRLRRKLQSLPQDKRDRYLYYLQRNKKVLDF